MTFSERVSKMIEIIKDSRLALIAKGETVPYDDDIPDVIEQMAGGQDTQQLINLIEDDEDFSLIIPNGCTKIRYGAFYYNDKMTAVTIPSGVTTIGNNAFTSCTRLASVEIPAGVTTIGDYVFYNCTRLASVEIPAGVTTIGNSAFYNCMSLASVKIPAGVTTIGIRAFYDCTSLAIVDLTDFTDPSAIPTLSNINAFSGVAQNCVYLVANAEMKAAFSSATNWSNFTFTIQGA